MLCFIHNNQDVYGIMLHVVNDFKLNLDFLCFVGNQAAAEHVQLLKIRAHLLMFVKSAASIVLVLVFIVYM